MGWQGHTGCPVRVTPGAAAGSSGLLETAPPRHTSPCKGPALSPGEEGTQGQEDTKGRLRPRHRSRPRLTRPQHQAPRALTARARRPTVPGWAPGVGAVVPHAESGPPVSQWDLPPRAGGASSAPATGRSAAPRSADPQLLPGGRRSTLRRRLRYSDGLSRLSRGAPCPAALRHLCSAHPCSPTDRPALRRLRSVAPGRGPRLRRVRGARGAGNRAGTTAPVGQRGAARGSPGIVVPGRHRPTLWPDLAAGDTRCQVNPRRAGEGRGGVPGRVWTTVPRISC
jgi:hypothetical protein